MRFTIALGVAFILLGVVTISAATAQSFGVDLHNTMMPASGGMAGASICQPQDLQSAINGNPATLTQFRGTQFSFGGGWAEPTYNISQLAPLPLVNVTPYSAKSGTPGGLIGNIGVIQDLAMMGLPATFGMGFITGAGAGVDFRDVPESNGTSAQYMALDLVMANGILLTERLSAGSSVTIGSGFMDGPFVDLGGMVPDYSLRGTLGANFCVGEGSSLGMYWQSKKNHTFDDAVLFPIGTTFDLAFDHPENIGFGYANSNLMGGRLLFATDVLFKRHSDADFLKEIFDDQWILQIGTQYCMSERMRFRLGYAINENPMRVPTVTSIGGVQLPDGNPALRYIQGQFAAISQHRLTVGVGIRNIMPGMDLDFFGGGMFENTEQFATTVARVESYWLGYAMTWRFGADECACPSR